MFSNQFCAVIELSRGSFRLRSEAFPDILLIPEAPVGEGASPGPGSYKLAFDRQGKECIHVTGSPDGTSMLFYSQRGVDVRLTPQACLGDFPAVDGWYSPFHVGSNKLFAPVLRRVVGRFTDWRSAKGKGRKHAGTDLRGTYDEAVYPIAAGLVIALSFRSLTGTVVVKHRVGGGKPVYSKYIHLQDIPVKVGQAVTHETRIGRLFGEAYLKKSRYKSNHLHLEIRKDYEDKGLMSSYGMNRKELRRHCYDPLEFLRSRLD